MCAGKRGKDRVQKHGLQLPKPNDGQVPFSQGVQQSNWSEIVISLWAWMNQAHAELSPKIGNWLGKSQQNLNMNSLSFSMAAHIDGVGAPPQATVPKNASGGGGHQK